MLILCNMCNRYANVTLGLPCIIDSTFYTGYGTGIDGVEYSTTVVRDNCLTSFLYCEPSNMVCVQNKGIGQPCASDRECVSVSIVYFFLICEI